MKRAVHGSEIRVLIADDEPLARRGLHQVIQAHGDCRVVAESRNGNEALRALRSLRPDVVFLDIQMPGLDGFQVMRSLGTDPPPIVVLVTAYDEFAVRAFEAHALDYLLKPVSQERFDMTMRRVRERMQANQAVELSQRVLAFLHERTPVAPGGAPSNSPRSIVVPTVMGELVLDPEEVEWVQAKDYYAVIHALGGRHLIRESLASLEQRLDPARFVRVHRSAIVQLDRVRELRTSDRGHALIVLRDGTQIPVSRRRRDEVATRIRRG
jgi:two-component system LytT family response regulator